MLDRGPVADLVVGDVAADLGDHAGDLVADGQRVVLGAPVTADGVDVGVADPGPADVDAHILRADLAPLVREVTHDGLLVQSGFLRREALQRLVAEDAAGQQDRSKHLWHVLTLEYWYRGATQTANAAATHAVPSILAEPA